MDQLLEKCMGFCADRESSGWAIIMDVPSDNVRENPTAKMSLKINIIIDRNLCCFDAGNLLDYSASFQDFRFEK